MHSLYLTSGWLFTSFFCLPVLFSFTLGYQPLIRLRWLFCALVAVFLPGILGVALQASASNDPPDRPGRSDLRRFVPISWVSRRSLCQDESHQPGQTELWRLPGSSSSDPYTEIDYHLIPGLLGVQWLFQPILFAAGLGIPLLLMEITARTPARRFYSLLFG
jgi:hypothetical protein